MALKWIGPPPTKSEVAALRRAVARGDIPANATVRRIRVKGNPAFVRNEECWRRAKRAAKHARAENVYAFANAWYQAHCMNPSFAPSVHAFQKFHWGGKPRHVKRVRLPSYAHGVFELGKLRAVEYETTKGRERAVWVHKFSAPYPSLTGTARGKLGPIVGGRAIITERGIER